MSRRWPTTRRSSRFSRKRGRAAAGCSAVTGIPISASAAAAGRVGLTGGRAAVRRRHAVGQPGAGARDAARRPPPAIAGRDGIHSGKPYGVAHAPPPETQSGRSISTMRGDPAADREQAHPLIAGIRKAAPTPCSSTRSTPPVWPTATKRPAPISSPACTITPLNWLVLSLAVARRYRDLGQPHDPALRG